MCTKDKTDLVLKMYSISLCMLYDRRLQIVDWLCNQVYTTCIHVWGSLWSKLSHSFKFELCFIL